MASRSIALLAVLALALAGTLFAQAPSAGRPPVPTLPAPFSLRTEYLANPAGIDTPKPRFSWLLDHPERGQVQAAYQVLVSASAEIQTADVWDSGRVESGDSIQVAYAGKPVESGKTYYWKVRYWDATGRLSNYSDVATFETGLLAPAEWKGKWVGGENQLRKEFILKTRPARARAYISSLGYYELRINGRKVGDHVLDPGWTTYPRRVLYVTYDVTDYLQQGANTVAVTLGQGRNESRAFLLQVNIDAQGEKRQEVVSDTSWRTAPGPIVADSIYNGETYDARLETAGWDRPGFKDAAWKAAVAADPPKGVLSAQMMPPIKVVDTITPLKMSMPRPGVYVFDMGQNFSGWVRLRVRGPKGTRVRLRHAEALYADGTVNTENLRKAQATDVYIARGGSQEEIYEPRFTYHGFRYVEVTGYPGVPSPADVAGMVVRTAVADAGGFSSSNPVLDEIQRMAYWSVASNLHSVPTDSDQRDERRGWLADAHLASETAMLNFDMAAFYTNFLRDIRDAQAQDGSIPDTVPYSGGSRIADPAWGSAYPLIAWYMYVNYGDRRVLEENFAGIRAWTDYLGTRAENGVVNYYSYGDWASIAKTPGNLVSTAYYTWSADITARAATVLGKTAEANAYLKLAAALRDVFHRTFFFPATGNYSTGSQTALALPLYLNMTPAGLRSAILADLVSDIVNASNTHLTTGIVGTKYLFPLLTRVGRSDLAYELATQTTYPSWGYMAEKGATSVWEVWQEKSGSSMSSQNSTALASIGAWLYSALAGINPDATEPGFKRVRIEPQVVRDLQWVSGSVETVRGLVVSSWGRSGDTWRLEVTIPVGSVAEIHVPKLGNASVTIRESGKPVWVKDAFQSGIPGLKSATQDDVAVTFETGSGSYVFEVSAD